MIAAVIRWSIDNRFLVLLATGFLVSGGLYSLQQTPVDALPDLSDVQVIIKTSFPGQAPQVVEDQVTYPLTTAMLSVPKAVTVRGYSFFGDSYVYIIFEDGTDLYWARSRVLEYLSQVTGPTSGQCQDRRSDRMPPASAGYSNTRWSTERVSMICRSYGASRTGSSSTNFRQFRVLPRLPQLAVWSSNTRSSSIRTRCAHSTFNLAQVRRAIQAGNQEAGGSVIEMGEAEYMVRATGYLQGLDDLSNIPFGVNANGTPILLSDIAELRLGPQMRRGIAELDGEGEVVGGVIVMRWGENASKTIDAVKERLDELSRSLPAGVEIVTTYDRSALIDRAVETLEGKLIEEFLVVALVCAVFLFHLRSSASDHYQSASRHSGRVHRDENAGHQCEHHVAGWHCDRDRRDGRCGDRDGRKRA